jgi:MFS family permease
MTNTSEPPQRDRPFTWFHELGPRGRRAFNGAFGGWGLDSYDFQVLPLGLAAITAYFGISKGQAGLLTTVTLVMSALGGLLAGMLADRIGRTRTLIITVAMYAVFTVLCGFAPNYETLLVLRAIQGIGFGGEWATGAILVAEYASARHRGRTVGFMHSAWAVGWGLAVVAYTAIFSVFDDDTAWRVLFWTGALPALLLLYLRRSVSDAPIAERRERPDTVPLRTIFGPRLIRVTIFASLLGMGVQGGYYSIATWLPTFLKEERDLTVVGTGGYLSSLISGAFLGYITGAYVTDWLGRRKAFAVFAVASAVLLTAYTQIPEGANTLVLVLGFPLGFCSAGIFSGFGAFFAELFPTTVRGTGQGFAYNLGRGLGAFFPTVIGYLSDVMGLGGAMLFGVLGYALALVALAGLPETRGRELVHDLSDQVQREPSA